MSKIPRIPEEIFDDFLKDLMTIFPTEVLSVALYGSGARGEYVPKKSDINFLVILSEDGIHNLSRAFDLIKKWRKRRVATPLFMSERYINSSLDSFPIEFLNMKKHHKSIYGQDILSRLEISGRDLRLKCEEQLKGKLLHLREEFLRTEGRGRLLRELLLITISGLVPTFTALLDLHGQTIPREKDQVFFNTAKFFDLDDPVFAKVLSLRDKKTKLSQPELVQLSQQYIEEIRKLAFKIDQM